MIDDLWKDTVQTLRDACQYVIIDVSELSDNLLWELEHALGSASPNVVLTAIDSRTSFRLKHAKSTMYGPMGTCRLNLTPAKRWARNRYHSRRSASVIVPSKSRTRTALSGTVLVCSVMRGLYHRASVVSERLVRSLEGHARVRGKSAQHDVVLRDFRKKRHQR